ncbi:transmembrane protein 176B isoform X2 [Arvicola amphibius]|nr:transmembrane protein 176B isoform X2 [Arvicola amphibius]XP_038176850.1 transmembrane protein 176B isoform X2 [Arvicola amphibius]XP_038176851.1 transmembrane protein 176B isoform X2 [Arvicola amphibius]
MAQTTVMVNGAEVASALPTSPHVHIHIHHHSALGQLLRAMGSVKKSLSRPQDAGPSKASIHHGLLALGVTQILLGLVSCVLGVCIYFGPETELHTFGYAFWSGSVAVVAGTGTIVNEKRRGKLTGHISRLLILACTATAVAATVLGVNSLTWQTSGAYRYKISSTCDSLQTSGESGDGLVVRFTDDTNWRTERCREYLRMMMNLFLALCIMLTVVCILKIVVSLASLGLSLQSMCGQSSQALDKEEAEKKLLGGDSTPPSPTKAIPVIL